MKRSKSSPEARLKRANDKLWSEIVRTRDGKCLVCGTAKSLQAHHAVVLKSHSLATRWHPGNGVALCYMDHLRRLHSQSDAQFLRLYLEKLDAKIPIAFQEGLIKLAEEERPDSTGHLHMDLLRGINFHLTEMLEALRKRNV